MPYRIDHRGTQHVVIDDAGTVVSKHISASSARDRCEALNGEPPAPLNARPMSRSAAYRWAAEHPEEMRQIKESWRSVGFMRDKGTTKAATENSYHHMMRWMFSADVVGERIDGDSKAARDLAATASATAPNLERSEKATTRLNRFGKAAAVRRTQGNASRAKVLTSLKAGKKTKAVAAETGLS